MMAEDLAERLQRFDMTELRQAPLLVNDLTEHYFNPHEKLEALSPDRVRRASSAACTLFNWSARMVEAAAVVSPAVSPTNCSESDSSALALDEATDFTSSPTNASEVHLASVDEAAASEDASEEEELEETGFSPGLPPVTIGIWATCPGGHGLESVVRGMSLKCKICNKTFDKGADSASCRECDFFVCRTCRTGAWLSVSLPCASEERALKVVGFRWLRRGEDAPSPLSVASMLQQGSPMACWGQSGVVLQEAALGKIDMELRPSLEGCTGGVVASITGVASRFSSNRASGVFSLTDERARNAAVLALFAGFPGVR
jgi:hypothetical protein